MLVETKVVIACRPSEAFDLLSDITRSPAWQSGITTAFLTSPPPFHVGSTYEQEARFLGKRFTHTFEVTEFIFERLIACQSLSGSFPIRFSRTVEAVVGGTLIVEKVEGQPKGVLGLFEPIIESRVRSTIESDYERLKQLLESDVDSLVAP